jgi:hypothetical protein
MTDYGELESGRLDMTREELLVSRNRFERMHGEYERLIASDPKNAGHYQILIEHCRLQSQALGKRIMQIARGEE